MSLQASSKNKIWDTPRSVATARVLTQLGFDHGVSVDAMLRHTGITRDLLDDPQGEIDAQQEVQLIRNLIQELPHLPTLGLTAGTRYHVTTYGLWGFAVMSSPNLGAAVSMGSRMLNMTFALMAHEVEQVGELARISFHADHLPPDVRQFVIDRDRAAAVTLQREVLGRPLPYRAIHMRRPEPAPDVVAAYTDLFGVRPLFGQPQELSLFEASVLQQPLPEANSHTAQLCEQMCRKLVEARHARTGVAAAVRDRLLRTPGHIPDMEQIAGEMRVTSRTLRRHLTAEGTTFRTLLEEVRSTLAEELMARAALTHGEIAERLGYADVTTFIEAFRRWKGVPPSTFRRNEGLPGAGARLTRRRFLPR
jgi:AraC-like DNA-binding protein